MRVTRVVVLCAIAAIFGGGLAIAGVSTLPGTVSPGDAILAEDFNAILSRLEKLEAQSGGMYCGTTPAINGARGGYAAVKLACEAACSSSTAYACTSEAMVRSIQVVGVPAKAPAEAYLVSGVESEQGGVGVQDCLGWTSNSGTQRAHTWRLDPPPHRPGSRDCSNNLPLLCCD